MRREPVPSSFRLSKVCADRSAKAEDGSRKRLEALRPRLGFKEEENGDQTIRYCDV